MNGTQDKRRGWSWWYLLFVVQFVAVLWPPFYNSAAPYWHGHTFLLLVPDAVGDRQRGIHRRRLLRNQANSRLPAQPVPGDAMQDRELGGAQRFRRCCSASLPGWGLPRRAGARAISTSCTSGDSAAGASAPLITWFLVGGDLYTAYTFIAVPALAFGAGALAFFAVPYTIVMYPILFLVFPRLWYVCHKRGYITAGDFVRGRFGNRWLALAVTVTGIVATMPYIALQLVGIQVVIGALGISGTGLVADLPLLIAFVVLAAFTYSSGLRAPASIAIVKDILIYITAFVAIIVIPIQLGGFGKIFAAVPEAKLLLKVPGPRTPAPSTAPTPPWRSARRWLCSSIRIP